MKKFQPLFILAALVVFTGVTASTTHAGDVVYEEDFSSSVVWDETWDLEDEEFHGVENGAYRVRIKDEVPLTDKYAYHTWDQTVENASFRIEFDFIYNETSYGQPITIALKHDSGAWSNEPIKIHFDDSHSDTDLMRVINNNTTWWSPMDPELGVWYHFNIFYSCEAGYADWAITKPNTGAMFWHATDEDFVGDPFNQIGIGTTVVNGEGDFSGLTIDNIKITSHICSVPTTKTSLSSVKALFR